MKCNGWKCENEPTPGYKSCTACREKYQSKNKAQYAAHKEKRVAYAKEYRAKNAEKARAAVRKSRETYIDKRKAYMKNYFQTYKVLHRDKLVEGGRAYREANKVKELNRHRIYYSANRDKFNDSVTTRRLKQRSVSVVPVSRIKIFERDNWTCQLCGYPVDRLVKYPHYLYPTIDHITPISKGGTHEPGNVQCAHLWCNFNKNNRATISHKPDFLRGAL